MSSVTINGHTYTDDADPGTGMAAGGHRTRFIPALADVVVVAGTVVSNASIATSQAGIATAQANAATASASIATTQAGIATAQAGIATAQANAATASAAAALVSEQNAAAITNTGFPNQSGQSGKFLISNGSAPFWGVPSTVRPYFMAGW